MPKIPSTEGCLKGGVGSYHSLPPVASPSPKGDELPFRIFRVFRGSWPVSMAGAKVLHSHAVQFAKEKNIAIYARSAFEPGKETVIRRIAPGTLIGVQAVVSEKQVERIRLHGKDAQSLFKQAAEFLESEQVPIKEVSVAGLTTAGKHSKASFVVSCRNIYGWESIKAALKNKIGSRIDFDTDLAALSLIGEGLNRNNLPLLDALGRQCT